MLASLNWVAVLLGALVLWFARFAIKRIAAAPPSDANPPFATSRVPSQPWPREAIYFAICVVVAACVAAAQNARAHSVSDAAAIGLLLSLVPVAYLMGMTQNRPWRQQVRPLGLALGLIAASVLIFVVSRG